MGSMAGKDRETGSSESQPPEQGRLKSTVDNIRREIGAEDRELLRQVFADMSAADRQNQRNHFEGRLEYIRQVHEHRQATLRGVVEYGLQTLKWVFLLNAGAIAIVMAYVSGGLGKYGAGSISNYTPVIKAVWPFVGGCISIALAGACAFFNFSYYELHLPSSEMLHNFLAPTSATWPIPRGQRLDEKLEEFVKRVGWRADGFRKAAIALGLLAALFFAYGVFRVLHAVLT